MWFLMSCSYQMFVLVSDKLQGQHPFTGEANWMKLVMANSRWYALFLCIKANFQWVYFVGLQSYEKHKLWCHCLWILVELCLLSQLLPRRETGNLCVMHKLEKAAFSNAKSLPWEEESLVFFACSCMRPLAFCNITNFILGDSLAASVPGDLWASLAVWQ